MGCAEGVAQGRSPALRRVIEAISEAWRERASERRAAAVPRPAAEPRLRRSRLGAALDARLAVRSGVRLDDFLRHRLARYAVRLPVTLEELPVTFDVEGGEAVVRPRPPPRRAGPDARAEPPPFARALVAREGPNAARELRAAEAALDGLDARVAAARARLDALEVELAEAMSRREVVAPARIEATPEQLGRPPVPSPAFAAGLRVLVAALLAAEAWRFAPAGIEASLRATPVPAGLALALAVGAAAAAFTFAGAAAARAAEAISLAAAPARRGLLLAAAAGAALLGPAVVVAAAASGRRAELALLAVVPFAGAVLWRWADALGRARAVAAAAALDWDRERAREALERGRREEVRARAQARLAEAEGERAQARRRLAQLHRLAVGVERSAELAARSEARRLDRLAEGLACALELDRYLYLRLSAAEQARAYLERPARTPRLEPAVAPERLVAG
jgi:hypothetical protein